MATKKAKPKAKRIQRWQDDDGAYIDCFEDFSGGFFLAWMCEDGEGGRVGEYDEERMVDPKDREKRIMWLIYTAAKPFASSTRSELGTLLSATKRDVMAALRAVNFALYNDVIWPAWALEAQAHGWTPPAGWKP